MTRVHHGIQPRDRKLDWSEAFLSAATPFYPQSGGFFAHVLASLVAQMLLQLAQHMRSSRPADAYFSGWSRETSSGPSGITPLSPQIVNILISSVGESRLPLTTWRAIVSIVTQLHPFAIDLQLHLLATHAYGVSNNAF